MRKLGILLGWNNFAQYYAEQVAETVSEHYEADIVYDHGYDFSDHDVVWAFFPQHKPISKSNNVVKTYYEINEFSKRNMDGPVLNVATSFYTYQTLLRRNVEAKYVPFGVNSQHFNPQPFPSEKKIVVGWCGVANNGRKQFDLLSKTIGKMDDAVFKPNAIYDSNYRGQGKFKDAGEMGGYYKDIDVYVCSSSSEGFGLPLLEASACGRPVVTFNVGIARELETDGAGIQIVNGFNDIPDAVRYAYENRDELGKMSSKATDRYWRWPLLKDRWLHIFDTTYDISQR